VNERFEEDDVEERDEVARLRERVRSLEAELEGRGGESSPVLRWAGWILGTLVGATSLALIVLILGGGLPGECECEERQTAPSEAQSQQQQQVALERLLRQHSSDFQDCFEGWASQHAEELRNGWSVLVRLEIEANDGGEVQRVSATGDGLPRPLGDCLEQRVGRWSFPGPGPYTMELPFAVDAEQPAGSDAGASEDGSPLRDAE